ncbi:MAG: M28 family metallopeptidase [Capnocytophaga sp.]|nr:M28 family metallopeptidase [Capnocytophaga sp.]
MKYLFIGIFFFVSCNSQKKTVQIDNEDILEKYVAEISEASLRENLTVIASDEMQGRDTGSEGIRKAAAYIVSEYEKEGIGYPPKAEGWFQTVPSAFMRNRYNDSDNIWAYIEGSEYPDEVLVLSAHYDHVGEMFGKVYNGADDNGSGTVAVMEIAKVFAKAAKEGHRPKRSILFLHVTGEERGLLGSDYYSQHPLYPLENTIANINIDMIGRIGNLHKDGNYIYVIGSDRLSTDLHNINEAVNSKYANLNLDYKYNDRNDPEQIYYRSDHYNFAKHGIPSVFFFNGVHADYHMATDTVEKIEFEALHKRTQLIFALAWELANRSERIKVDRDGN